MRLNAIVALTLLVSCNGKSSHVDDSTSPGPVPSIDAPLKETVMIIDAHSAQWKQHVLDAIGLTLDLFADGDTPKERDDAMSQTRGPVTLSVMWGPDSTLESLQRHFAGTAERPLDEPKSIQCCGLTALSLTIETPDRGTVTGKTRQGKGIYNRLVARVHRIVAFERRGTPVLVRWVVDLDARDAHRALEDHFFDSVTCAD